MHEGPDVSSARDGGAGTVGELQPGAVIGGRYRIVERIAEGGMATVFLADDLKHSRRVAVKVLHEALAHTIGIQRFLREIEVVARLQHPHLLTLIDSGTVEGLPYYVMPYVEALSLRETLVEKGPLPLQSAITIAREIADGLAYAHQHGVVHRDIKPSNILMSDGHAVVADFGIATALTNARVGRITVTGTSLGSPTYMSPEQAAGEQDVDGRSDVYSLACVVYEMLAGEAPVDHVAMQQIITRKLTGEHRKLREHRPDIPVGIEAVIHRALAPAREARHASVEEFAQALGAAMPKERGISRRAIVLVATAAVVMVTTGVSQWNHQRRVVVATQRVGEINRLVQNAEYSAAFTLAEEVLPLIPGDTTLQRLRPLFTDFVNIVTEPPGATVSVQRIEGGDSGWTTIGLTPLDSVPMPKFGNEAGNRVRIERAGFEPLLMLQHALTDLRLMAGPGALDTVHLTKSGGPNAGMIRIRGAGTTVNGTRFALQPYYIGRYEVTNEEYMAFVDAGGYSRQEFWTEPMMRDGHEVAWDVAIALFRDRSGLPGPSTWSSGRYPPGQERFPVGGVSYYEAAAYARFAGKQLPTSTHWVAAAMFSYREAAWVYLPSSNLNGAQPRPVGQGNTNGYGLYDVTGNVREWCVNPLDSGRVMRGGAWDEESFGVGRLVSVPEFDRSPVNGFRLISASDPDSVVRIASRRLQRAVPRDFRNEKPVSDAEFSALRRLYDYDKRPLDVKLESEGETTDYRWQVVSFSSADGRERMEAYLMIPRNVSPPLEPVIFWQPGPPSRAFGAALNPAMFAGAIDFIPRSRRVLVWPIFKGLFHRRDSAFTAYGGTATTGYRDAVVHWVTELRRTIDFIESRTDMKPDRIGFYGLSWGAQIGPIALAIEPRIRAAVLNSGGYPTYMVRPEIRALDYAPRVEAPTLMLNGEYDSVFPYQTNQVPLYQHLGSSRKEHIVSPRAHLLRPDTAFRETLAWFDRHLSGKQ